MKQEISFGSHYDDNPDIPEIDGSAIIVETSSYLDDIENIGSYTTRLKQQDVNKFLQAKVGEVLFNEDVDPECMEGYIDPSDLEDVAGLKCKYLITLASYFGSHSKIEMTIEKL